MEALLPDCEICKSEHVKEIEKRWRFKKKILPLAKEYAPKFNRPVSTMRVWLKLHFDNLHRKYRIAEQVRQQEIIATLEDKGINFESYKDKALQKAILHLEDPDAIVKPTDVAALENVSLHKAKLGLEQKQLELRMAQIYGGFTSPAIEGEIVDDSTGVLPESTK